MTAKKKMLYLFRSGVASVPTRRVGPREVPTYVSVTDETATPHPRRHWQDVARCRRLRCEFFDTREQAVAASRGLALWLRLGDDGEYLALTDEPLRQAAELISAATDCVCVQPHATGVSDGQRFRGDNYISLYWGPADKADLVRVLRKGELSELNRRLKSAWWARRRANAAFAKEL